MNSRVLPLALLSLTLTLSCLGQNRPSTSTTYDVLIRNGLIYDGSGQKPYRGDIAIRADRVVAVGKLTNAKAATIVDAKGKAVAPGFINVLSHTRFARLLGKYVREEKVITLEEAVRRLTSLPATNHKLTNRGFLKPGYFADVVIFDPATIADKATFENPFQYAVGVQHIWINGKQVLRDGEHTGVLPGRALWGPGKRK